MKKSSHFGAGLLAGALLGVAAGIFANTPKGKQLTKDVMKNAKKLQAKLQKELKNASNLTKEKYEELADKVMDYYAKGNKIAKSELPAIRKFLMDHWKQIEKQMKSAK